MSSLRNTGRAIVRPLLRFALTLFAASIIIFALMRAVPGNPARVALGVNGPKRPSTSSALSWDWTARCSRNIGSG